MKKAYFIATIFILLFSACGSKNIQAIAEHDLKNIAGKESKIDISSFRGPIILNYNTFKWYKIVPGDSLFIVIQVKTNFFSDDLVAYGSHSKTKELKDFPKKKR